MIGISVEPLHDNSYAVEFLMYLHDPRIFIYWCIEYPAFHMSGLNVIIKMWINNISGILKLNFAFVFWSNLSIYVNELAFKIILHLASDKIPCKLWSFESWLFSSKQNVMTFPIQSIQSTSRPILHYVIVLFIIWVVIPYDGPVWIPVSNSAMA